MHLFDVAARKNFVALIRLRRLKRIVGFDEHARVNQVVKNFAHVVGQVADVVFAVTVQQLQKRRLVEKNRLVVNVFTALGTHRIRQKLKAPKRERLRKLVINGVLRPRLSIIKTCITTAAFVPAMGNFAA